MMLLSTRKSPPGRLPLAKSGTSSLRYLLLHSPLPSPALPSIVPRHGKKPSKLNVRKIVRFLCWLMLASSIWTIYSHALASTRSSTHPPPMGVNHIKLPHHASVIALDDMKGGLRWTIYLPDTLKKPLPGKDYAKLCAGAVSVAQVIAQDKRARMVSSPIRYGDNDPNYISLTEARQQGLLPSQSQSSESQRTTCKRSLTYVLDTTQAGLGEILLGLWLSYGLAKREQRTFILEDTEFAFGSWTRLFTSPKPDTSCSPPSWNLRTPYPRNADHLIIAPSTHKYNFDKLFNEHFNVKEVYKMAREGFEALFTLRQKDHDFVRNRLSNLRKPLTEAKTSVIVGIHIRRGDRHPFEYQYQHGYLPPSKYLSAAQQIASKYEKSAILLASDDADIYHDPEVEGTIRAQQQIRLASKKQLGSTGWEGGFFTDSFWSIGLPDHERKRKYLDSPTPTRARGKWSHASTSSTDITPADTMIDRGRDYKSDPTPEALQLREYIGRAYLLDLAVLTGSDEIVCGVSSATCRVLGIMMGWDKLQKGKWKNVDGEYGWHALY